MESKNYKEMVTETRWLLCKYSCAGGLFPGIATKKPHTTHTSTEPAILCDSLFARTVLVAEKDKQADQGNELVKRKSKSVRGHPTKLVIDDGNKHRFLDIIQEKPTDENSNNNGTPKPVVNISNFRKESYNGNSDNEVLPFIKAKGRRKFKKLLQFFSPPKREIDLTNTEEIRRNSELADFDHYLQNVSNHTGLVRTQPITKPSTNNNVVLTACSLNLDERALDYDVISNNTFVGRNVIDVRWYNSLKRPVKKRGLQRTLSCRR